MATWVQVQDGSYVRSDRIVEVKVTKSANQRAVQVRTDYGQLYIQQTGFATDIDAETAAQLLVESEFNPASEE